MNKSIILIIFLSVVSLTSCKEEVVDEQTNLTLNFSHRVGDELFQYGHSYTNDAGNNYSIQLWRTYISDIVLTAENGEKYSVEDSYHLVEPLTTESLDIIILSNVPQGSYKSISFNIGISDGANLSGDLVGDLDPSNNMAWNWVKGYKFIRVDGEFTDLNSLRRGVVIHIGTEENLRKISYDFSSPLLLNSGEQVVDFILDLSGLFNGPHIIDFEKYNDFQFNAETKLIADNYAEGYIYLADD